MDKLKLGVLVSGRGSNLQAIIDAINEKKLDACIRIVISNNKSAYALERARKANIKTLFIDPKLYSSREAYDQEIVNQLQIAGVELVILAGYMRILTPYFVSAYKNRIMNIHPALLPSFPGLHAQKQALDYGVKITGVTVHFVDEGMDTGPIILQRAVEVMDNDTEETLSARILKEEHKIFVEAISLFIQNKLVIEGRKVRIR
jgi:phosphoribosylglycinamide formyltransferase-1